MLLLLLACSDPSRPFGGWLSRSVDADGDGWDSEQDCDDQDPQVNPSAAEVPYTGVDEDCDPSTADDDLDGDGYPLEEDCEDDDASVHPLAEDPPDGHDQDCDGVDSCGVLVPYSVPMTLYSEDLGFFCDSRYNATSKRLTVSTEEASLQGLRCLCEAEELILLTPAWTDDGDLEQLERIGRLEINGNEGLTSLHLDRAERVELLGLTSLRELLVEGADSLRLESHSADLSSLDVRDMDLETAANPGLVSLSVRTDGQDLRIADATQVIVSGSRAGRVELVGVSGLSAELVEVDGAGGPRVERPLARSSVEEREE